jgi:hypothetical protein
MSDSQAQSYSPAPNTTKSKRSPGVVVWLLVLLLAVGAFAAAFWYAGGTNALGQLGGLVSSFMASPMGDSGSQKPPAAAPAAATPSTTAATPRLPAEAQQRMFAEQVASRAALTELVGGQIASFELGQPVVTGDSATVPLTAVMTDGTNVSAALAFKKYQGTWYFFSLTRAGGAANRDTKSPGGFDAAVVAAITEQQAQAGTQELLTDGLLKGGYRTIKVDGVTMGPRTATVDVTLSGGTEPDSKGRLVCISKTDGSTTYWFVARFEKR